MYLLTWLLSLAYFSENIKTAMIEYKKFVSPQAVTNTLTEIENKLAESNELSKEIDEIIKCKLKV